MRASSAPMARAIPAPRVRSRPSRRGSRVRRPPRPVASSAGGRFGQRLGDRNRRKRAGLSKSSRTSDRLICASSGFFHPAAQDFHGLLAPVGDQLAQAGHRILVAHRPSAGSPSPCRGRNPSAGSRRRHRRRWCRSAPAVWWRRRPSASAAAPAGRGRPGSGAAAARETSAGRSTNSAEDQRHQRQHRDLDQRLDVERCRACPPRPAPGCRLRAQRHEFAST